MVTQCCYEEHAINVISREFIIPEVFDFGIFDMGILEQNKFQDLLTDFVPCVYLELAAPENT